MGKHFNVETRKDCKMCGKPVPKGRYRTYCSDKCRERFQNKQSYHKRGGAEYQREYMQKVRDKDPRPKIQCLLCNKWFRQVGSHVNLVHKITAREYRKNFGFDLKKGQLPPDYRELKSQQAIECGGYKNLKKGKEYWFKKGEVGPGKYDRSEETLERLRKQTSHPKKEVQDCIVCGNKLTHNQVKYCCKPCRQKDYKIKYNKHKAKLFKK